MKKYRYWCQACGSFGAPGDGPCEVAGHRSERLYLNRATGNYARYARPRVTEAVPGESGVAHLAVQP